MFVGKVVRLELYIALIRYRTAIVGRYVYRTYVPISGVARFKSRSLIDVSLLLVKYLGLSCWHLLVL